MQPDSATVYPTKIAQLSQEKAFRVAAVAQLPLQENTTPEIPLEVSRAVVTENVVTVNAVANQRIINSTVQQSSIQIKERNFFHSDVENKRKAKQGTVMNRVSVDMAMVNVVPVDETAATPGPT